MIYEEPIYCGKDKAKKILSSSESPDEIGKLLIAMSLNEQDINFSLDTIIKYCYSDNIELCGLAILCLSHVAKIHNSIPIDKIVKVFDDIITSNIAYEDVIKYRVVDSLTDFYSYCPSVFNLVKDKHRKYLQEIDIGINLE